MQYSSLLYQLIEKPCEWYLVIIFDWLPLVSSWHLWSLKAILVSRLCRANSPSNQLEHHHKCPWSGRKELYVLLKYFNAGSNSLPSIVDFHSLR
jgi:hypothetical protein